MHIPNYQFRTSVNVLLSASVFLLGVVAQPYSAVAFDARYQNEQRLSSDEYSKRSSPSLKRNNMSKTTAPYGSWKSPINAEQIASNSLRLGEVAFDGDDLYYLEGRPSEAGRTALVVRHKDGTLEDALPKTFNVRTLVHEYGGGAFTLHQGNIFFVNFKDQLIYFQKPGSEPVAITKENKLRYADMVIDEKRNRLICVCEDHSKGGKEPENKLVSIDITAVGTNGFKHGEPTTIASGYDFYSYPRLSPDAQYLSYIAWRHPNMPWDGTDLHLIQFEGSGAIKEDKVVAGNKEESVFQPVWSPEGKLFFVNDSTGWWNLEVIENPADAFADSSTPKPVIRMNAEFGMPLWVFKMTTFAFMSGGRIICQYCENGVWKLGLITKDSTDRYSLKQIQCPYTDFWYISSNGTDVGMQAGSPTSQTAIVHFDLKEDKWTVIKESSSIVPDKGYVSVPQVIEFPTANGKTAFAFFYPPANKDYEAPAGELPPLVVESHGGPTGSTSSVLSLGTQYWTSRGVAVVDVNYGGSTGFGREYRNRLKLNWGIVDMQDCENAAKYLVEKGLVDGNRLAITGGSAGGYTTLCALTFTDRFKAGASHYGIGDVEALCADTHKFESRYGDYLFGPYPEKKQDYYDRSPINFTDKLNCPVIFFQGLEDKVVPPSQAEAMVEAIKKKGLPVAYIAYEGEQHGFRKAENIKRTIEAEFYFFAKIFGYKPADETEPVQIENLARQVEPDASVR
ncbi:S9 family peptidase [Candidatus Obscuribacterales bacterium]|nr:S9 family peptidase [Candidatus Obscuribacterales bacterium]